MRRLRLFSEANSLISINPVIDNFIFIILFYFSNDKYYERDFLILS